MKIIFALLGICLLAPCIKGECTAKFPLYLGDDNHDYRHDNDRDHRHDRDDDDDERRRHHDDDDHDHDHNEHRNWRGQRSD